MQVNTNGQWIDAPVQAATVQKLEDIILTRARDLRRAIVAGVNAVHRRLPAAGPLVAGADPEAPGRIGAAIERRLAGFEVASVTRVARRARTGAVPVRSIGELPALLPDADVVFVITPLTPETEHLIGAAELAKLADGALLVNVSRGKVVDTEALADATASGRVRAALDVTDPEPLPPDHRLWRTPGVLISPHVGGQSTAFYPRMQRLVRAQLQRFAVGEPLENVVA